MRKLIVVILLFFIFQACDKEPDYDLIVGRSYNLILIVGQSNTHWGIGYDSIKDAPNDHIKQLGRFNVDSLKIIDAKEPLQHHTSAANRIGFGLTFAKLLYEYLGDGKEILIIPCGAAGTGFEDNSWNKGDDFYEDAIFRVDTILKEYPKSKVITILWHQGEDDVYNVNYQENLDDFIVNIRSDIGDGSIPFILGGMVPFWVNKSDLRQMQQNIISSTPLRHENLGYADPTLPFVIAKEDNTFDAIHYSAEGQRELGKRYFDQFEILYEKKSFSNNTKAVLK